MNTAAAARIKTAALTAMAAGGSSNLHLLILAPMWGHQMAATITAAATQPHPIQSLAFPCSLTATRTRLRKVSSEAAAALYLIRRS